MLFYTAVSFVEETLCRYGDVSSDIIGVGFVVFDLVANGSVVKLEIIKQLRLYLLYVTGRNLNKHFCLITCLWRLMGELLPCLSNCIRPAPYLS